MNSARRPSPISLGSVMPPPRPRQAATTNTAPSRTIARHVRMDPKQTDGSLCRAARVTNGLVQGISGEGLVPHQGYFGHLDDTISLVSPLRCLDGVRRRAGPAHGHVRVAQRAGVLLHPAGLELGAVDADGRRLDGRDRAPLVLMDRAAG